MKKTTTYSSLLLTLTLFTHLSLFGWAMTGHRVIGEVAQKHLKPHTSIAIKKDLGTQSLASISNWPDFIKSDVKKSLKYRSWHYINIPKGKSFDPKTRNPKGDILTALEHFTTVLKNKKSDKKARWEALSFIVHLVGDLHQPLHTGYKTDRGGNSVALKWFGNPTNLHRIWDENLISLQKLSYTEYAKVLEEKKLSKNELQKIKKASPLNWMLESRAYLKIAYEYKKGEYWEYNYNYKHLEKLNERLYYGGLRLAHYLDEIYKR